MATSIYTGPRTFTETDQRRIDNQFGQPETVVGTYMGLEADFAAWVPAFGSAHPEFPLCFLTQISRSDAAGSLLQVILTYTGTEISTLKTSSGLLYSNLQTETQLVSKSFSWDGNALVSSVQKKISFSSQFTTIEATFSYTAYNYPNAGQFQSAARILVAIINPYWILLQSAPDVVITGIPTLPTTINPNLVLTRFSAKQSSTSSYSGSASTGSVSSSRGPWSVSETWSVEYNLASLGVTASAYTF
jgi:hypothetical protein